MIALFALFACQCGEARPTDRTLPENTHLDRTTVAGATCYRGDDGTLLELSLSASTTVSGVITRPGEEPRPLSGRRNGRQLDFGRVEVELLGRTVTLIDGADRMLLASVGCP
ncbi:MAG: hypothetical protein H6737_04220 [Alphaproteobacteria bacterium]|nr:hypothetical protein [Alphaproteobacteria bacterium]